MESKSSTLYISFKEPLCLEHLLNNEPDIIEYIEKNPENSYLEIYEAYTKSSVRNTSIKSYDLALGAIIEYIENNYIPEDGTQAINALLIKRQEVAQTSQLLGLGDIAPFPTIK